MKTRFTFAFAFAFAFALSGCVYGPELRCPECQIVTGKEKLAGKVRDGAKTLYVIVPGLLGYGWEWDDAIVALKAAAPESDFMVFWYSPTHSFNRGASEFARVHDKTWASAPPSLERMVVVAHSGAGNLVARAAGRLRVPQGKKTELVTIGTPFGGMGVLPFDGDEMWGWSANEIILFHLRSYEDPAPNVDVIEYITDADPVTRCRRKHCPTDPKFGPRGAKRVPVADGTDHNYVVAKVVRELLARRTNESDR